MDAGPTSLFEILGPTIVQTAPMATVIGWMLFGMFAEFQDDKSRQDWLWSGLLVGILYLIMYLSYNAG